MANSLNALDPAIREAARELVSVAGQAGLQPRVTSTLRSRAEQRRLYDRFLRGQSAYPVAPPGTSAHEFGAAFDMVTAGMQALDELGALWESWGGVWGGRFKDDIHFEAPGFSHRAAEQQAQLTEVTWYEDVVTKFSNWYGLPGADRLAKLAHYAAAHPNASIAEQFRAAYQILFS